MNKKTKEFGLIFWIHLSITMIIYLSPFLFNWPIIAIFCGFFFAQLKIFGNCILTKIQFKEQKNISFHEHYLAKLGININKRMKLLKFLIPISIFIFSLFWQLKLKKIPLFF